MTTTSTTEPSRRRVWASAIAGLLAVVGVSIALGEWHRSPRIVADDIMHLRHRDHGDKHQQKPEETSALDEPEKNTTAPPIKRHAPPPVIVDAAPDDPTATAYANAVDAYRAKRWAEAATELEAFVAAHPDSREAEDAYFLEASALAHDGQRDAAGTKAEAFLTRYPGSFHAPDAAILVARSARDRGDCTKAREAVAPWRTSRPTDTETALGACAQDVR